MLSNIKRRVSLGMVLLTILTVTNESTAWAQPETQPQSLERPIGIPSSIAVDINLSHLMAKRASVDSAADLVTNKKNVLKLLDKAIQLRELADKINQQRDEISQAIKDAPDRLKKIQSAIDQQMPAASVVETEASAMSTLQLEQRLQQEEAELAGAQNNFSNWNIQLGKQKEFLQELPEKAAKAQKRLQELQDEQETKTAHKEESLLTEVQGLLDLAEQGKLQAEIKIYELQTAAQDSILSLMTAERDLAIRELAKRLQKMSAIREAQIELDRQSLDLANFDGELDRIMGLLGSLSEIKLTQFKSDVRKLLTDRRVLVEKLKSGYLRYLGDLQNLEYTEQQLAAGAEAFAEFLDRHLLWIKSSKPLGYEDLKRFPIAIGWMLAPHNWWGLISDTLASFKRDIGLWILGLLFTGFLLSRPGWARKDMVRVAGQVSKHRNDTFALTIWAFALTIYLAVGWPFLLAIWGLLLLKLPQLNVFTRAVAHGLVKTAEMLAALRFFYLLFRDNGLGQIHFDWNPARCPPLELQQHGERIT